MTQARLMRRRATGSGMALALGCVSGIGLLTLVPELPPTGTAVLLLCAAAGSRRWPVVCACCLGLALAVTDGERRVADRLDGRLAGVDLELAVQILDFPDIGSVPRILVRPIARTDLPQRIRLSWYEPSLVPGYGECWFLTVRLRRPRGFSNPGRFDYERWLFEQSIGATGYVRGGHRLADCAASSPTASLRLRIHDRLQTLLPEDDARAVLLAVSLGARQWLTDAQWHAFSVTGTSHLMAISGLHIALAAGLFFGVARALLAATGLPANHTVVAGLLAFLAAVFYAAVSGFAIPARRAVVMLGLGLAALLMRRRLDPWQTTGLAALCLLLLSPLDAITIGFRLSFLAVGLLLFFAARHGAARADVTGLSGRLRRFAGELGLLQCMLLFGMLPLVVAFFGRLAWLSPATNLLVVPLFNLVTLPATLFGALLPNGFGDWLLLVAWRSAHYTLAIIDWFSSLPFAVVDVPRLGFPATLAVAAALSFAWLPAGWPGRGLAAVALLSVVLHRPSTPPHGCVDIHVLDVGQGLSTLLRTRSRAVLYDAGPAFRSGSDTGSLVVVPYLQDAGIDALDLLVVSHGDNDHAGGVSSVLDAIPATSMLYGEIDDDLRRAAQTPAMRCVAGQVWEWDGIRFAVLHPSPRSSPAGNNASCVIEVRAGGRSALLTGDIEAVSERALLSADLVSPVTAVLVPHHGSKTSSVRPFVDALSAETAIVSSGYANRWGMPRPDVVRRWTDSGARVLNTAESGAIELRLCADAARESLIQQRKDRPRFWHER